MKESYNTRFFQFFLVLVITIIVSEMFLTHVTQEAYASESSDNQLHALAERDSTITQAALKFAFGEPKEVPAATVAMAAAQNGPALQTNTLVVRESRVVPHMQAALAVDKAQEAIEKSASDSASEESSFAEDFVVPEDTPDEESEYEEITPQPEEEPDYDIEPEVIPEEEDPYTEPEEPEIPEEPEEPEEPEVPEEPEEPEEPEGMTYMGNFKLTAYCPCASCCGVETGITASGTIATEGRTVAADPNLLPYGTVVYIEGHGTYTVEDCGGFSGNLIDIFFNSHDTALQFGLQYADVYIVN